jgi:hypothetical protein
MNSIERPESEDAGYYAEDTNTPQRYFPVAFSCECCCWVEIRWSSNLYNNHTFQPANDNLHCNILTQERLPLDQQGPLDHEDPAVVNARRAELHSAARARQAATPVITCTQARTPAPSEASTEA